MKKEKRKLNPLSKPGEKKIQECAERAGPGYEGPGISAPPKRKTEL